MRAPRFRDVPETEKKNGGDTRDFGLGPAVMREPSRKHNHHHQSGSLNPSDAADTKKGGGSEAGGDTRDFGFGPSVMRARARGELNDNPSGDLSGDKKGDNGGDTRDFGFGPGVMLEIQDNPSGDTTGDRKGDHDGDTRDFGFGVAVMLETSGSQAPTTKVKDPMAATGWPSQKDGVNQIPEDWKSDVAIVKSTRREEKARKRKRQSRRGGRKVKGGKARKGEAAVGNDTNPFLREELPDEQNSVKVVPVAASEPERLLAINPEAFQRECPVTLCPPNVVCPIAGGTCCGDGKLCCPPGASCLNSKPSLCVWNTRQDPDTCDYEQCQSNYTCPFSGVPTCCRGGQGRSCCNVGYQCVPGDPPSCQKLSTAGNALQTAEFEQLLLANERGTISLKAPPQIAPYAPALSTPAPTQAPSTSSENSSTKNKKKNKKKQSPAAIKKVPAHKNASSSKNNKSTSSSSASASKKKIPGKPAKHKGPKSKAAAFSGNSEHGEEAAGEEAAGEEAAGAAML